MCIIVYHPPNAELPDKDTLKRCFIKNDDGAGMLIKREGGLRLWKGFMKWADFWQAYRTETLNKDDEFALHFRWATSGGVEKGKCHPFPIDADVGLLHKVKFRPKEGLTMGMMHNGVLGEGEKNFSDTMVFIRDILSNVVDCLDQEEVLDYLKDQTKGSKLLMFWKDKVIKTGTWVEDKTTGLIYSNDGYKERTWGTWDKWQSKDKDAIPWYGGSRAWERYLDDYEDYPKNSSVTEAYECPQCEEWGYHKGGFVASAYSNLVTCCNCGCMFRTTGIIVGYNENIWRDYEERYAKVHGATEWVWDTDTREKLPSDEATEKKMPEVWCPLCQGSSYEPSVTYDTSVELYYCFTCESYFRVLEDKEWSS